MVDMSRQSIKEPNLVDVRISNIGCHPGSFACKLVLYLSEPVCDNENCIEALCLW